MNRYALMARDHWGLWLPTTVTQMSDPEKFFTDLGLQVERAVDARAAELVGPDTAGEGYLAKLGRLRMARFDAEAMVLGEMVLLPPEPGHPQADPETEDSEDPAGQLMGNSDGWWPLEITPGHPFWSEDDETPADTTSAALSPANTPAT